MAYRAIVDTVGHSESLAKVSHLAERLYWRLIAHSDAHGRIPGSPSKTRAMCFPLLDVTHQEVGHALVELEEVGRIWVYEVDGTAAIQIVAFDQNQPKEFLRRRGDSRLPNRPKPHTQQTMFASVLYELPANGGHSGTTPGALPDHSGTKNDGSDETPANGHHSRTTPASGGSTPSPKDLSIEVNPTAAVGTSRARDPELDEAAAADVLEQIEELGLTGEALDLAQAEPARAQAWLQLADAEAETNPAGFVLAGLRSNVWPSARLAGATAIDPETRLEQFASFVRRIGFDYDRATLDLELDERHITDPADRQAMHRLAAEVRGQQAA